MSSEPLYAEFSDGTKLWGIYYGTADCILRRLFETQSEAEAAFFCGDDDLKFERLDVSE